MKIATVAERPELLGPAWDRTRDTLPEYNNYGDVLNQYRPRLTEHFQDWTGMTFPHSGDYWFTDGLTTVHIYHERDRGSYWEPNVWMRHTL